MTIRLFTSTALLTAPVDAFAAVVSTAATSIGRRTPPAGPTPKMYEPGASCTVSDNGWSPRMRFGRRTKSPSRSRNHQWA